MFDLGVLRRRSVSAVVVRNCECMKAVLTAIKADNVALKEKKQCRLSHLANHGLGI